MRTASPSPRRGSRMALRRGSLIDTNDEVRAGLLARDLALLEEKMFFFEADRSNSTCTTDGGLEVVDVGGAVGLGGALGLGDGRVVLNVFQFVRVAGKLKERLREARRRQEDEEDERRRLTEAEADEDKARTRR